MLECCENQNENEFKWENEVGYVEWIRINNSTETTNKI